MKKYFILLILFLGAIFLIWWGVYSPKATGSGEEMLFKIEKGEGAKEIAFNLQKQGLIKWSSVFRVYVLFRGISKDLQAGVYKLSPSMSIHRIANKFAFGDIAKETIIIPEGWNLRDIGSLFDQKGMFQAEDLWKITGFPATDYNKNKNLSLPVDFSQEFESLKDKPKSISLEGYLFPDTYQIAYGTPVEEVVKTMIGNFDRKLGQDLISEIKKQKKTIFQIITMASLIEKEVKTKEDKELVSGILWKRLLNKMPLQVDATISYILSNSEKYPTAGHITGEKTTQISKEQTQIDSSYNTYKYRGLPLGPISNPGIESIETAIYPKSSQYWYYLSAPDGKTILSKTLEEHNAAKAKYLK